MMSGSQVAAKQSADNHVAFKRAFKALGPGQSRGFGRLALVGSFIEYCQLGILVVACGPLQGFQHSMS